MLGRTLRRVAGLGVAGASVGLAVTGFYADQLVAADPHEALLAPALLPTPFSRTRRSVPWTPSAEPVRLTYDFYQKAEALYGGDDGGAGGGGRSSSAAPKDGDLVPGTCVFVAPPSFVSSRSIFLAPAVLSSERFVVTETPGYGANAVTAVGAAELTPRTLTDGIECMLEDIVAAPDTTRPLNVIATGHSAPYLADIAQRRPELVDRLVLLNPTVSGPLPSAEKKAQTGPGAKMFLSGLMSAAWLVYQIPLVGPGLHFVSQSRSNIEHQLRTHVYIEEKHITEDVIQKNVKFARTGTSLPKCAFLVGKCDTTPEAFQRSIAGLQGVSLLMGKDSPEDTQSAMILAKESGMPVAYSRGALRSFQEYPVETAAGLRHLLRQ